MKARFLERGLSLVVASTITAAATTLPMSAATQVSAQTAPSPAPSPVAPTAGTQIINQAVGTYSDGASHNFYTTSNQVVVTVQNAPSVSITGVGGHVYTAGQTLVDHFTVTNNGNAQAALAIPANGEQVTFPTGQGVTGITQPAYTYTLSDPTVGTTPATYTAQTLNSLNQQILPGQSLDLWVQYPVPYGTGVATSNKAPNNTTSLSVQLTQAKVGTNVASAAATSTGTALDTITNEAQLDLATAFTDGSGQTAGQLTITTKAENSGGMPARGLQSAANLIGVANGATSPGILAVQQIPNCVNCGGRQRSQLIADPVVTTDTTKGFVGTSTKVLYATSPDLKTWNTVWKDGSGNPLTVYAVGVYVTCTATADNTCFNGTTYPAVSGSQSANDGVAGAAPNPALTIVTKVNYPTGYHSGDANAFSTISNGVVRGNVNNLILGPGFTDCSTSSTQCVADSSSYDITPALKNTTPLATITGASNQVFDNGPAGFGVTNGPLGNPAAVGTLDNAATGPDTNGDFTAYVIQGDAQGSATKSINTNSDPNSPTGVALTFAAGSQAFAIENTLRNEGTVADTFTLSANLNPTPYTVPAGFPAATVLPAANWSVEFHSVGTGNTVGPVLPNNTTPSIPSAGTFNYYVVYIPTVSNPNLMLFTPYQTKMTATSVGATSTSQTVADATNHVLFANGYVQMSKTVTSDISQCTGNVLSASAYNNAGIAVPACPGAILTYTVKYRNLAPDPGAPVTDPSNAKVQYSNISLIAKGFQIVEDGTGSTNSSTPNASNWAQYSTGLTSANGTYATGSAVDSLGGGFNPTDNTSFNSRWGGTNTPGSTHLIDNVGDLAPGGNGTLTFSIQLKKTAAPVNAASPPTTVPAV